MKNTTELLHTGAEHWNFKIHNLSKCHFSRHHGHAGEAIGKALQILIPSAIVLIGISAFLLNRMKVPANDR
jgi:hypothetical protein